MSTEKIFCRIVFGLALFGGSFCYAQGLKDDPKVDETAILKTLGEIEKAQKATELSDFGRFEKDLNAVNAPDEAVRWYTACYKKINFEGTSTEGPDWSAWREKNQKMLSDKNFGKWLLFQIRYLKLWVKAYKKTDISRLEDPLVALVFEVRTDLLNFKKEKDREVGTEAKPKSKDKGNSKLGEYAKESIGVSMAQTVFVKAYHIEDLFKETPGWDLSLERSEVVLENVLMKPYREAKNPGLFDIWEKKIEWIDLEAKILPLNDKDKLKVEDDAIRVQWKMAEDYERFGLHNKSINLMFNTIKKATDHPDFDQWRDELKGLLTGKGIPPEPVESKPVSPEEAPSTTVSEGDGTAP